MTTTGRLRRIAVLTGTRAEYGLLRPVIAALAGRFTVELIVAGQHLLPEFGNTVDEVEADGWNIAARVPMMGTDDGHGEMAKGIARGIDGIANALMRQDSDAVVVLGDRVEAFAAAVAGAALHRLVVHLHGGEVTRGGLDESMRHAITKLAHLHFVATQQSRSRLLRMGEAPDRIVVSGAPGLDTILSAPAADRAAVESELGRQLTSPVAVLVQHPVSSAPDQAADEMRATLDGLRQAAVSVVALYPNSDAGGRRMIEVLESYAGEHWLTIRPTLSHHLYLGLLRLADVLVGNSSSGIIEAPSFGLPVVNIGSRQHGRERGENIVDVPHQAQAITTAVRFALEDGEFRRVAALRGNPYGDGQAARRIADALTAIEQIAPLIQKQFCDETVAGNGSRRWTSNSSN